MNSRGGRAEALQRRFKAEGGEVEGEHANRSTEGVIVIIPTVSLAAGAGQPELTAVGGGLVMVTKAIALELATYDIRVAAVAAPDKRPSGWMPDASRVPLKRSPTEVDVAAAVAFLASPDAPYITGAVLPVGCGWSIE